MGRVYFLRISGFVIFDELSHVFVSSVAMDATTTGERVVHPAARVQGEVQGACEL